VRTAWRAHLAAAGQRPGQRARLLRQQAVLLPRFAAAYGQLQALPRPQRRRLFRRLKQSLASLALLLALGQAPALAATMQVDGTTCTMVDAIIAANTDTATGGCPAGSGADTLVLAPNSVHTLTAADPRHTQYGNSGLVVTSAITIAGHGSTIQRASSAPAFRIFAVGADGALTVQATTVSGGTTGGGGGVANSGGGVANVGGTVTFTNSTVSGNSATIGGGVANFGGTVTFSNSTVSGNSAGDIGGGVANSGGTVTFSNSTVSGNSAIYHSGGVANFGGTVTLARTLVSGNTAPRGPEIYTYGSIVADNHNLFGHDGAAGVGDFYGFTPGPSDVVPSGPLSTILASTLAQNGGPTPTLALVPGSPALDVIPATDPACTGTDQRGVARPQGPGCDIGAVEADVVPATTLCSTLGDDRPPSLLDQDLFRFTGTKGETVTLTLAARPGWQHTGERATLILLADIRRVLFVRTDSSALPSTIAATLPATGRYLVTVAEQPSWARGEPFLGDYCVTLESSGGAWQTLVPTDWVEGLIE
jgi:hypothetical protein